jgi:hypothetical protein
MQDFQSLSRLQKGAIASGVALLCLFVFRPKTVEDATAVVNSSRPANDQPVRTPGLRTPQIGAPTPKGRAAQRPIHRRDDPIRILTPRVEAGGARRNQRPLAISTAAAWNHEEITDLGRELREAKDADERMTILRRLLSGMTSENALAIRDEIHRLSAKDPAFREFHLAFGALLGAQAVLSGADTPKPDIALAMEGWANADPAAALAWFSDQPLTSRDYFHQRYLALGLVRGLADSNLDLATEFLRDFAADNGKSSWREQDRNREAVDIVAKSAWRLAQQLGDPQDALAWAEAMPEGYLRNRARATIASRYALESPEATADWVETFAGESGSRPAVSYAARGWAKSDPEAALNWLSGLGETGLGGYHAAFITWGRDDAVAAGQYLVAMPVSEQRDSAIRGFANALVSDNARLALQWANSIADPDTRGSTYRKTFASWALKQPKAAEKHLAEMSPSANRDRAISAYAPQTAKRSPQEALDWAATIENPALRDNTLLNTGRIVFSKNAAGFAQWLPTSGLSPAMREKLDNANRPAVQ